ncbi:MAG: hypothetical protein L0220_08080 [Acidobacteria bacterium]|nr:hypothetical protein [Acidobacteriota bacterium]
MRVARASPILFRKMVGARAFLFTRQIKVRGKCPAFDKQEAARYNPPLKFQAKTQIYRDKLQGRL